MKSCIMLIFLSAAAYGTYAQVNIGGDIEKGYRDFLQQTRTAGHSRELSDFVTLGGEKRFFSNNWEKGRVTNMYGASVSSKFNYDFLDKELYAFHRDSVIALNINYVTSFYVEKNGAVHYFIKIPSINNTNFLESIGYDSTKRKSVHFLKDRSVVLIKGDKNSYLSNFNGDYADNLKDKSEYYLYFPDGSFTKVKMDKKSLSAALEKYADKTAPFFSSVKKITEENIKELLALVNP